MTTLTFEQKLSRLQELLSEKNPGLTPEALVRKLVDEALEQAEADAEARAFHITFRDQAPVAKHLSLVTD